MAITRASGCLRRIPEDTASRFRGVYRLAQSTVNKDSVRCVCFELMADIGPETVAGGPVCADAQEYQLRPCSGMPQDTLLQLIRYLTGGILFFGVYIRSHVNLPLSLYCFIVSRFLSDYAQCGICR